MEPLLVDVEGNLLLPPDQHMNASGEPLRLYCLCRTSDDSRFMIGCDKCDDWFHPECVGLDIVSVFRLNICCIRPQYQTLRHMILLAQTVACSRRRRSRQQRSQQWKLISTSELSKPLKNKSKNWLIINRLLPLKISQALTRSRSGFLFLPISIVRYARAKLRWKSPMNRSRYLLEAQRLKPSSLKIILKALRQWRSPIQLRTIVHLRRVQAARLSWVLLWTVPSLRREPASKSRVNNQLKNQSISHPMLPPRKVKSLIQTT